MFDTDSRKVDGFADDAFALSAAAAGNGTIAVMSANSTALSDAPRDKYRLIVTSGSF